MAESDPTAIARPSGVLNLDWQQSDGMAHVRSPDAFDPNEGVVKHAMLRWDPGSNAWVKFTALAMTVLHSEVEHDFMPDIGSEDFVGDDASNPFAGSLSFL